MTLSEFFLSPRGRISRQEYWLGMLALMAVTLAGSALFGLDGLTSDGGRIRAPSLASTLWSLLFAWPSTAVSVKRFNDRDWPAWLGYALGAGMVAFVVANYHGLLLDPDTMGPAEKLVMVMAAIAFLWALIENGFQRGTPGPNRFGA
jgi:uncharacterized membrane protein YhaH (DUF805 family)